MIYQPTLTILYQFNPWRTSLGGIQTVIKQFIKYAPSEFKLRLVGTGIDDQLPLGQWVDAEFEGKPLRFMPLIRVKDDNVRKWLPTTLRYTAALRGKDFSSEFIHFHRLEPSWMAQGWSGEKTLFIHNDIRSQMLTSGNKDAMMWSRFPGVYFALEKRLIQQFSWVLSCNSRSAELLQTTYPTLADRVRLIKNSVDDAIFYPLTAQQRLQQRTKLTNQLQLPPNRPFVLFAGRLHPQKDPVLLVRAFAQLMNLNPHLLIAGEGEMSEQVRAEVARLRLNDRVTFLGAVEQHQLVDLYRLSAVTVLTSHFEGLPLVVLESLASGTPIVSTNAGETPDIVNQRCGVICRDRSPSSVADALRQVLQDPNRFAPEDCYLAIQPYLSRAVIGEIYQAMYERWKQQTNVPGELV